jgi:hypothetical protein
MEVGILWGQPSHNDSVAGSKERQEKGGDYFWQLADNGLQLLLHGNAHCCATAPVSPSSGAVAAVPCCLSAAAVPCCLSAAAVPCCLSAVNMAMSTCAAAGAGPACFNTNLYVCVLSSCALRGCKALCSCPGTHRWDCACA